MRAPYESIVHEARRYGRPWRGALALICAVTACGSVLAFFPPSCAPVRTSPGSSSTSERGRPNAAMEELTPTRLLQLEQIATGHVVRVSANANGNSSVRGGLVVARIADVAVIVTASSHLASHGTSNAPFEVARGQAENRSAYPLALDDGHGRIGLLIAVDRGSTLGPAVAVAATPAHVGAAVVCAGFGGGANAANPGHVLELSDEEVTLDCPNVPGSEGGVVFSSDGEALAIVTTSLVEEETVRATLLANLVSNRNIQGAPLDAAQPWTPIGLRVEPGQRVSLVANGSWSMGFFAGRNGAAGRSDYEDFRIDRGVPFGAVLCGINAANSRSYIGARWPGTSGDGPTRVFESESFPAGMVGCGPNDTEPNNNGNAADGPMTVVGWVR
jgi:hypothetical protein